MTKVLSYLKNPWVLLVLVVVIAFIYYKLKEGGIINVFNQVPLPVSPQIDAEQAREVRSIAQRLHTDMDGVAYPGSRDTEAYSTWLGMSDSMFVAVYNDFGNLYYREGEGTLRAWIEDENFAYTFSIFTPGSIVSGSAAKDAIIARMNALNLQ